MYNEQVKEKQLAPLKFKISVSPKTKSINLVKKGFLIPFSTETIIRPISMYYGLINFIFRSE